MANWNPWHGCHKISEGCRHCYVYRSDSHRDRDASEVTKNGNFGLPIKKDRHGSYKLQPEQGTVYTCFTSDFLLEDADKWRQDAWEMMRLRSDLHFLFITKRIHRLEECLPPDWNDGYENVTICCTVENQDRTDFRLPIFLNAPIRHKEIICSPLLEAINLGPYLTESIEGVTVGGESGPGARLCDYNWVLQIRDACHKAGVPFHFQQTGANFRKDGRVYRIPRKQQHRQARLAGIEIR